MMFSDVSGEKKMIFSQPYPRDYPTRPQLDLASQTVKTGMYK